MFCLEAAMKVPSQYYLVFEDDAQPLSDFPSVLAFTLEKLNKCQSTEQQLLYLSSWFEEYRSQLSSLKYSFSFSSSSENVTSNRLTQNMTQQFVPDASYVVYSSPACVSQYPPYTSDYATLMTRRTVNPSPDVSFAFIKLYVPDRLNGFAYDLDILLELVSYCCVGGGVSLLIQGLYDIARQKSVELSWRVFRIGIALSFFTCVIVGRQSILEIRRLSKFLYRLIPANNCSTPCMVYPAPMIPFLVQWLAESPQDIAVDLSIASFREYYQAPAYHVQPNIVRHLGHVTSLEHQHPIEEFLI